MVADGRVGGLGWAVVIGWLAACAGGAGASVNDDGTGAWDVGVEAVEAVEAGSEPACPATPQADQGALATCLTPTREPEYYVQQGLLYFDTLDATADPRAHPAYGLRVARWEWPPWLKLTGYGREQMISIDRLLVQTTPSTVPQRDCRAFAVQPFCRCRVVFQYLEGACPIYEEFTFDDQGQTTFIEAWSDAPGLLPMDAAVDPWGEGPGVTRLSTRVPGLGDPGGLIELDAPWMAEAAAADPDVADFVTRAKDFWPTWKAELQAAGTDLMARGCGW
jgi:hypothetical protein